MIKALSATAVNIKKIFQGIGKGGILIVQVTKPGIT